MTFKNQKDYLHYLQTRKISIEKKMVWAGDYLDDKLGRLFEIIRPRMPLQDNAKYRDWKIHFERHIPCLKNNLILIGISLGGIFLAKYLAENKFPKKILAVYLVCPPFDDTCPDEDLVGGFKLGANLSQLEESTRYLHLMFSRDDDSVPISHAEKYRTKLKTANIRVYSSKNGHFRVSKFPEIVTDIRKLVS